MSIVEQIKELCTQNNMTLAALERELGFSKGSIRYWDDSSPAFDRVIKVADYFHLTTDYFAGRKQTTGEKNQLSQDEVKYLALLKSVNANNRKQLLNILKSIVEMEQGKTTRL